jgi:flagellar P-ring protein precursor FlgI
MIIRLLLVTCMFFASIAHGETRIKDITSVDGLRDNMLVGYGLVVGLSGTGDNLQNSVFTQKGIVDYLEKLGLNTQGATLKTKNVAAVMVTANLPPFAHQGLRIDVKVSALGDAKSIRYGTLLATPLLGADGNVYAVAQGHVAISDFHAASDEVKTKNSSTENNGFIQSGAIVENEIGYTMNGSTKIRLSLNSPDFTTALKIADAINNNVTGNTASALDPATVDVVIPNYRKNDVVQFVSEIESLGIEPDYKAKVVVDEATGTVVIGANVHIRPVAIAQGNLIITIADNDGAQYPASTPAARQINADATINKRRGMGAKILEGGANLSDLVAGLNKLGVYPRDIVNILYNMKAVGALDAALEVK